MLDGLCSTQKFLCHILSCDTLVANARYADCKNNHGMNNTHTHTHTHTQTHTYIHNIHKNLFFALLSVSNANSSNGQPFAWCKTEKFIDKILCNETALCVKSHHTLHYLLQSQLPYVTLLLSPLPYITLLQSQTPYVTKL